ncbi:ERF family protein [uncultured Paraglaciecola sp.]|uniref:ERF family protein n=1 Tax=uncultured Paraglaciecola sp. TaxID=1765024 RepID=UPI0026112A30|nr:ERF family protein [uncultured Paraglaciecola sp.]
MNKSESISELASALSKAQGQIKGAVKDSANPFFKSKYADLSSVWEACRDALSSNELSIVQSPETAQNGITIETMLCHSSGQWITSSYVMPVSKVDAQAVGSAITYARRYALAAMVGVAPEDDDGNSAAKAPPTREEIKVISSDQAIVLTDLCKETKSNISAFCAVVNVSKIEEIPADQYQSALNSLKKKKAEVTRKTMMEDVPQ